MSEHLTAAEQGEVFKMHWEALLTGDAEQFETAAMALCATATNHVTGYALCYGLARALTMLTQEITEAGQQPVTAHHPANKEEARRIVMAGKFLLAAGHPEGGDDKPAHEMYCRIERQAEHDDRMLSALIFFLVDSVHQMGLQLKQAIIDREGAA